MKQSKFMSSLESLINIAVGLAVAMTANAVILPLVGFPVTLGQNAIIAAFMTVVSFARSYALRRVFEALHIRTPMSPGALAIIAERNRQISQEGWTPEHDLAHRHGELSRAGAAYLLWCAGLPDLARQAWPWALSQFNPKDDHRKNAVRGTSLGLAELDRMQLARKERVELDAMPRLQQVEVMQKHRRRPA